MQIKWKTSRKRLIIFFEFFPFMRSLNWIFRESHQRILNYFFYLVTTQAVTLLLWGLFKHDDVVCASTDTWGEILVARQFMNNVKLMAQSICGSRSFRFLLSSTFLLLFTVHAHVVKTAHVLLIVFRFVLLFSLLPWRKEKRRKICSYGSLISNCSPLFHPNPQDVFCGRACTTKRSNLTG